MAFSRYFEALMIDTYAQAAGRAQWARQQQGWEHPREPVVC
jgi:hypothetical protein